MSVGKKAGFIYIYTYMHLYESFFNKDKKKSQLDWLYIDKSIISQKKENQKRQLWNDRENILCKIGMTTKPMVSTRLLEWQNTCKNPVINLTPDRIKQLIYAYDTKTKKINSISTLLSKLELKKEKPQSRQESPLDLLTYKDGGFFIDGTSNLNLSEVENRIHRFLWEKYGKGFIYCYGCDPMGQKRHTEWFHLPIRDLSSVMRTIDAFCYSG